MVAYKSSAAAAFLRSPDPAFRAILLYGPDAGLVSERASALAGTFARRAAGGTEIVRLDDRDLAEDPARLEVELRTRPMFAASQVVRVTAGARLDVPSLKALLAAPFDNALIVEAGNLRPDSGLRKLFETNKQAAALPCYGDERGLAELIDAELAEAGLRIDKETRGYLMTRLGADQALSRSEVAKLALYAKGAREVTHDDIEAIVGDAAETALETFVYAASSGDPAVALREMQASRRVGHREPGGADRARPPLHPIAQGRLGADERRKRRAGDQVASAPPAFQARERIPRALPPPRCDAVIAYASPDPGDDQAVAPLARARRRARRALVVEPHL